MSNCNSDLSNCNHDGTTPANPPALATALRELTNATSAIMHWAEFGVKMEWGQNNPQYTEEEWEQLAELPLARVHLALTTARRALRAHRRSQHDPQ